MNKNAWDLTFANRFALREDELRCLYLDLYRGNHEAWESFVSMLYRAYEARPASLRELDEAHEKYPGWYSGHRLTGMQMYVKAFGGTLNGVRERLDYISACGVNYLHLMPLLESPEGRSDGGYAVSDFRRVQPELGTMADLAALSEACHERDMALCLDFVMNHTSEDHPWARKAREGDVSCQNRYFFYENWSVPEMFEQTVPQVFPTTAPGSFTWCQEAGKVVMTSFYPYQWDLNYANPAVFNDMTDNLLYLCNQGIDIIRLDAVPYIWKELGTSCRNLPQVHTLIRMIRIATEIVCPGTLLLGEIVMEPSRVVPYFGTVEKPECHLLYNVTTMASIWHTVATRDVRLLSHQLKQVFALPKAYTFVNYLRCHDDIGWGLDYGYLLNFGLAEVPHKKYLNDYLTGQWPGSFARGELYNDDPRLGDARLCGTTASLCGVEAAREAADADTMAVALRRDQMLHALMFTLSGIPIIYSGDEIGQVNDQTYHDDPLKADDSRYIHRGDFNWQAAENRHEPGTPEAALFDMITRLVSLRKEHRVFDGSGDAWLPSTGSDQILAIGRYAHGEQLLALFNFSDEPRTAWLHDDKLYTDLLTGEPTWAESIVLPACGWRWLSYHF